MRILIALALGLVLVPALGVAGIGVAQADTDAAVPIWGIVLGTVVVAGLLYLMVHGPDGHYYRYPYYGQYYGHYYHPEYRPYVGFWPSSAVVVTVAPRVSGTVLGIVVVDGHHYILSRDAGGHLYRYPYFGPYQKVYYRPDYHDYRGPYVGSGAYRTAPLRVGDARWDNDRRNLAPAFQQPRPVQRPANQTIGRPRPDIRQQPPRRPDQTPHQPQYNRNQQQRPQPDSHTAGGHRPQQRPCGHQGEQPCPNNGAHP